MHRSTRSTLFLSSLILCGAMLGSTAAHAQATRTWVSGVGDDANPCSRTAPCKTYAGAISKTAAGGEISTLDPGGFGAVTITKSITIDGGSQVASILHSGVNGVVVNGAGVSVTLRNLQINGAGTTLGTNGVRFLNGSTLILDNVKISNVSGFCVDFAPSAGASLSINNTVMAECGNAGVSIAPTGGGALASITNSRVDRSGAGFIAEDRTNVTITGSTAHGNSGPGFLAQSALDNAFMEIDASAASGNSGAGISADGAKAKIRVGDSVISGNQGAAFLPVSSGAIMSFGNNRVGANGGGVGTVTATPLK